MKEKEEDDDKEEEEEQQQQQQEVCELLYKHLPSYKHTDNIQARCTFPHSDTHLYPYNTATRLLCRGFTGVQRRQGSILERMVR